MAFEIEEPKYVLKLSMALSFLPNRNLQLLFSSKHNVRSPVLACGLLDEATQEQNDSWGTGSWGCGRGQSTVLRHWCLLVGCRSTAVSCGTVTGYGVGNQQHPWMPRSVSFTRVLFGINSRGVMGFFERYLSPNWHTKPCGVGVACCCQHVWWRYQKKRDMKKAKYGRLYLCCP